MRDITCEGCIHELGMGGDYQEQGYPVLIDKDKKGHYYLTVLNKAATKMILY